ncbi:hypothetical protein LSH36_562g01004 [Paralvinella palmiformis]|uniref:Uncharacterized protein n=1 Tax=Paralvinella palmiformis TaxID=53620 RepID=A0AAD9J699_9ANNE|nr:hypothetical protein LSH36_562g01004 [Paralvinella palmiformis]
MYIASVSSIDEMNMDFAVTIYFRQRWVDPRLMFDEMDHYVPLNYNLYNRIWVPDINFKNMKVGSFRDITVPNRLIYVYPSGEVYYSQGLNLQLECSMDLSKYPMDTQSCQIKLGSFGYTEEDIIVQWRNISKPVQTAEDFELAEFLFTGVDFGDCTKAYVTGTFSCRNATLGFERKFVYYLIQVYIPSVLVVILSWVAFWIDIDAVPARISLGLLTVLTMTTQNAGETERPASEQGIDNLRRRMKDPEDCKNPSTTSGCTCRKNYHAGFAQHLEVMSRYIFPSMFLVFNIFYWVSYKLLV